MKRIILSFLIILLFVSCNNLYQKKVIIYNKDGSYRPCNYFYLKKYEPFRIINEKVKLYSLSLIDQSSLFSLGIYIEAYGIKYLIKRNNTILKEDSSILSDKRKKEIIRDNNILKNLKSKKQIRDFLLQITHLKHETSISNEIMILKEISYYYQSEKNNVNYSFHNFNIYYINYLNYKKMVYSFPERNQYIILLLIKYGYFKFNEKINDNNKYEILLDNINETNNLILKNKNKF